MSFLISVPGKLKEVGDNVGTLLSRLTATRAGYLNTPISSRAPASTALLRSVWTNTRASRLDQIPSIAAQVAALRATINQGSDTYSGVETTSDDGIGAALADQHGMGVLGTHSTANSTWTSIIDVSGSGMIDALAFRCSAHTQNTDLGVRLTIDGVSVYGTDTDNLAGHATNTDQDNYGMIFNGACSLDGSDHFQSLTFWPVPFASQFRVEMYAQSGFSNAGVIYGRYRTF